MRSLGGLIQHDWGPYKKRTFGQRHTYREDSMWRCRQRSACCFYYKPRNQSSSSHQKPGERPALLTPYLGSLVSRTLRQCSGPARGILLQQPELIHWSSTVRLNELFLSQEHVPDSGCLGFSSESLLHLCTWAAFLQRPPHLEGAHHSLPLMRACPPHLSLT